MATLYPVWRGALTYHDGTLSCDGEALYRGTLQGADDPAPAAISAVSVGLSPGGIGEGQSGALKLTQGVNASGLTQWAAGSSKLTSRAATAAIADAAMGSVVATSCTTVATMGELLAMGAAGTSAQLTLAGVNAGMVGTAGVRTLLSAGELQPDAVTAPTVQQLLAPTGFDLSVMGSQQARVRQTIGDLFDGQQGNQHFNTRLTQTATAFAGSMGTPVAKYAQIIYPTAPDSPATSQPVLTITLAHSALVAPLPSPVTIIAQLGVCGIDAGESGATRLHRLPLPSPAARDLLPPSVTRLEHLAAAILASDLTPELITATRFADTCPAQLLPWLAWARSVDWWELAESEDQQRALIRASFRLHQRKGTPWAIKEALSVLGFGDSSIIERSTGRRYDGTLSYNGNEPHGDPTQWAVYRVILARPVTTGQANRIKRLLAEMAPARCHLAALDYTKAPLSYNGAATYNGNYNHGVS